MKSAKLVLGILAGAASGALVGILFAPEKGSRTRRRIMNKGEDYGVALKDRFDDLVDTIGEKYESTWHDAENMFLKGKSKYAEVKKEAKNTVA